MGMIICLTVLTTAAIIGKTVVGYMLTVAKHKDTELEILNAFLKVAQFVCFGSLIHRAILLHYGIIEG